MFMKFAQFRLYSIILNYNYFVLCIKALINCSFFPIQIQRGVVPFSKMQTFARRVSPLCEHVQARRGGGPKKGNFMRT